MTNTISSADCKLFDIYLEKLKNESNQIKQLVNCLSNIGDIFVIGGAIRDILFKKEKPRDIDLIIKTDCDLDEYLTKYSECRKNRFGGYKLNIDNIEFDIWSMKNHWAFKESIIKEDVNNLKYSTFLNFDSLIYNINTLNIDYDIFNDCMDKKELEITLPEEYIELNPSKEINILRMFVIKYEWNLDFSNRCKQYIYDWAVDNQKSADILYDAQLKHYKCEKITKNQIENWIKQYNIKHI